MNETIKAKGYVHPTTIAEFETIYREEYKNELEDCDKWIKWCEGQNPYDTHGMNFYQGMRSAHVFNNIKMEQLLRVLKQEAPNQAAFVNKVLRLDREKEQLVKALKDIASNLGRGDMHPSKCDALRIRATEALDSTKPIDDVKEK